jgi:cell division protein FtsB
MFDAFFLTRVARRAVGPVVWLTLLAYLSYHAFVGERGIYTHARLEKEVQTLTKELDRLTGERRNLEHRIALLSPPDIDPDMLDERARAVLNFADPREIMIIQREK